MTDIQLKNFKKWVKFCQKQGFSAAKCGEYEFSSTQSLRKTQEKTKSTKKEPLIEGLTNDPDSAMPPDSEMLFYSTDTFDSIRGSRKDPIPRL